MSNSYHLTCINDFTYNLKINGELSMPLYLSMKKLIKSSHIDNETDTIIFSAENVIPFKKKILGVSYAECIKLINNLSNQKWPIKEPGMDEVYIVSKNFIFFD